MSLFPCEQGISVQWRLGPGQGSASGPSSGAGLAAQSTDCFGGGCGRGQESLILPMQSQPQEDSTLGVIQ